MPLAQPKNTVDTTTSLHPRNGNVDGEGYSEPQDQCALPLDYRQRAVVLHQNFQSLKNPRPVEMELVSNTVSFVVAGMAASVSQFDAPPKSGAYCRK